MKNLSAYAVMSLLLCSFCSTDLWSEEEGEEKVIVTEVVLVESEDAAVISTGKRLRLMWRISNVSGKVKYYTYHHCTKGKHSDKHKDHDEEHGLCQVKSVDDIRAGGAKAMAALKRELAASLSEDGIFTMQRTLHKNKNGKESE